MGIILASFLGSLLYLNHLQNKLDAVKAELAVQQQIVEQKELEIQQLVAGIEKQNEAIEKLQEETENVNASLNAVTRSNNQVISKMNKRIAAIVSEVVPTDCAGAMENLHGFAAGTAKEWNSK